MEHEGQEVGPEAAGFKLEGHRQGSTSFSFGMASVVSISNGHGAGSWHNPFRSGLHFSSHAVNTLAFSPDSKRIAFSCGEAAIFVAEIAMPGSIFTYQGHADHVSVLTWSPDGESIASLSSSETGGEIQIWEVATGKLLVTASLPLRTHVLQWSPNGKFIAVGGWYNMVHIVHPLTGEIVFTSGDHTNAVTALAWSPDSTRIASANGDSILAWEMATGAHICTYRGHSGGINAVAWSPDGTRIASGGNDMTIHVWDAATRATLLLHRLHSSAITTLGWSYDGGYILVGNRDNTIQVCDVKDGSSVFDYYPSVLHTEHMGSIAWSPDLNIFAVGGEDRRVELADRMSGKVLLCRAPAAVLEEIGQGTASQQETTTTGTHSLSDGQMTTTTTTTTTFPPSGPPVVHTATRRSRSVHMWGGKDGMDTVTYFGHKSAIKPLAWSPDSSRIASGGYDGSVHVWDAATGTAIFLYHGHLDPVVSVAWSPDGTRLASGSLDQTVKVWDLLTGQEILTYRGHTDLVRAVAWSPDSARIVSGCEDGTAQVWDATTGKIIQAYNEHTAAISSVDWSVDGQHIASGSHDQTVHIWDAATGSTVFVYRDHTAAVLTVAWSPDGKSVASGSVHTWRSHEELSHMPENEAPLHIWGMSADPIYVQSEHPGIRHSMESIAWSPDGQMLATLGRPYMRIHDANTGEAMAMIMHSRHEGTVDRLLTVAWSPDGTRIAGCLDNGRVQVWPAHT